ncbi:MAG: UDP-glucose 4-epimerase GalE [Kiloniellales bacterium]|nr:UDP-glucose 4-epimerase GalE [Kiloniellales bacterium]MDJ0971257.1 UDP-glucose 4-epimerase GalE [Kiloniellales bacterium]MDJ0981380.1 UDP-glucose 4-epimerase GalE [Kiloniellales bacterium]
MTSGAVLVTGGAGYIGSHVVLALLEAGYPVVVVDDLSTGQRDAVAPAAGFVEGDIGDVRLVAETIHGHGVTAVMHFAGAIVVPESVANPLKYYLQNTCNSRGLIQTCVETGVRRFVFSSTAAVYGNVSGGPVPETAAAIPESPYGTSKLMTEWILRDAAAAHDLAYAALRYFNVAGADPKGRSGQSTPGATHLIKVACEVAAGQRPSMEIFGDDYETPDGTCVRDYIHVTDLAEAHLAALRDLETRGRNLTLNCGYGRGYSVKQVLEAVEQAAGSPLAVRSGPRRPGDVAEIVADATQIGRQLGWRARHDDLHGIVRDALAWERKLAERS